MGVVSARFVVDKTVLFVGEALRGLGEVALLAPAEITSAALGAADVLWVGRDVRVDAALLEGSPVRLVATPTSGVDHLDIAWLRERDIAWVAAPDAYARSVALWWTVALATLAARRGLKLGEQRIGIVGLGRIGRLIEEIVTALGAKVMRCDPWRAGIEGPMRYVTLEEMCRTADLVTLHAPLVREGPEATLHMMNAAVLGGLSRDVIVVNAARGDLIDGAALREVQARKNLVTVLDAHPGEPAVSPGLVDAAAIATPHVAGYTVDARAEATRVIYEATCAHLGVRPTWRPDRRLPAPPVRVLACETRGLSDEAVLLKVLRRFYRIEDDDQALRRIVRGDDPALAYARYRAAYPPRREPNELRVELRPARPRVARVLAALGVEVGWLDEVKGG